MRKLAIAIVAAAVAAMAVVPAALGNGADVTTQVVKDVTQTIPFTNPCTGETAMVTITYDGVVHQVNRPNDTFMTVTNIRGTFFLDPDAPGAPNVRGTFSSNDIIAAGSNTANTQVLKASGVDDNGQPFELDVVIHLTMSSSGQTISFTQGC
jgi:hypothetical protein